MPDTVVECLCNPESFRDQSDNNALLRWRCWWDTLSILPMESNVKGSSGWRCCWRATCKVRQDDVCFPSFWEALLAFPSKNLECCRLFVECLCEIFSEWHQYLFFKTKHKALRLSERLYLLFPRRIWSVADSSSNAVARLPQRDYKMKWIRMFLTPLSLRSCEVKSRSPNRSIRGIDPTSCLLLTTY